jgi:DNA invertase Pin-like site-specific DNA recombinase
MISSKKCQQKAIIFARVSTQEQASGHSLDAQVCCTREYCKKKDFEVINEFQSVGNQSQFNKMIKFVERQQEKIVLVAHSVNRLQRVFKEIAILDELIKLDKIEIHYVQDDLIANKEMDGTQKFRYSLNVLLSGDYSKRISERTKRVIQEKLERGEWICKAPFGYKNVIRKKKNDIVVNNKEAIIVDMVFRECWIGGMTYKQIGEKYKISASRVVKILNNPFYYGVMYIKSQNKILSS